MITRPAFVRKRGKRWLGPMPVQRHPMATISGPGSYAIGCASFSKSIATFFLSSTEQRRMRSPWHNFASPFTASSVMNAHIENDECGACEFYTGGSKLIPTRGANGKIDLCEVEAALLRQHELHSHKPRLLSVTQATEVGTVYTADEIGRISAFVKKRGMLLHMDGARFANAVAALRCAPREITWQAGMDALSFGGTKNGLAAGELVIFFNKQHSADFGYRAKQGGHLASKMRFLAAPWIALLENDVWLKNAQRANDAALRLANGLRDCGAEIVFPVESNAVFVRLDATGARKLREIGWDFYKFVEPNVYRLMCAWSANDEAITALLSDYGSCVSSVR